MDCPLPHQKPTLLDDGYTICRRHTSRLREHLTSLADIICELPALLTTPAPLDGNDIRAARTDAPAPCRLDVLDLTDPRSDTPAIHLIDCWTKLVKDERQLSDAPIHPDRQARWLLIHLDWLTRHEVGPEFADEMNNAWRWVRNAAGMSPPPPIMMCPVVHPDTDGECGGPVFPEKYTLGVRCARCGETWDGAERLARLGMVEAS